jgi:hypothetical protein
MVARIDIRCCSGSVVPNGDGGSTVYATVLFPTVEDATRALSLTGRALLGNKIVVRLESTGKICSRDSCIGYLSGYC